MITFYLQAEPMFDGELRVLEFFKFVRKLSKDKEQRAMGQVEDSIKQQHSDEYEKFAAYVQENQESVYAAAKNMPSEPYFFDYDSKEEVSNENSIEEPVEEPVEEDSVMPIDEPVEEDSVLPIDVSEPASDEG